MSSAIDVRRYGSDLPPHQPHIRSAVRELFRADDLESMPTVKRDIALPLRLEVGRKTIGVALAQNRGQDFRGDSAPLPVGMCPQTFEVPVRLGRVHFAISARRPWQVRLSRRPPQRKARPSFGSAPRRRPRLLAAPRSQCTQHRSCRCFVIIEARIKQSNNCLAPLKVVGRKHPGNQRIVLKCPHLDQGYLRKIVERGQSDRGHRVKCIRGRIRRRPAPERCPVCRGCRG